MQPALFLSVFSHGLLLLIIKQGANFVLSMLQFLFVVKMRGYLVWMQAGFLALEPILIAKQRESGVSRVCKLLPTSKGTHFFLSR